MFFEQETSVQALKICERCPVRKRCLDYGLAVDKASTDRPVGIFGGVRPKHRTGIKTPTDLEAFIKNGYTHHVTSPDESLS